MDINPVAWFILKCTLEYPQKLAGQTRPLPEFALADRDFMEAFLKAKGFKGGKAEVHSSNGSATVREKEPNSAIFPSMIRYGRSRSGLARAGLGPVGAVPRPPRVGCLLSHLRRVPALDSYWRGRPAAHCGYWKWTKTALPNSTRSTRSSTIRIPEGPAQPALGRQAHGGLPVGAHRVLQAMPGHAAPAQDPLAVQEGQQARPTRIWSRILTKPALSSPCSPACRKTAATRRSGGNTTSASGPAPCPAPARPAPAAAPL